MARFIGNRLLATVVVLVMVTSLVFSLTLLIPGDAADFIAGPQASTEQIASIRTNMGLDRPVLQRYGAWIGNLLHGNLGKSLYSSESVGHAIGTRAPATLSLAIAGILLAIAISIPAGTAAAWYRNRTPDAIVGGFTSVGLAVPTFWLGSLLVLLFALRLHWFPAIGFVPFTKDPIQWARSLVLPALTLSLAPAVELTRQMRGSMLEVLDADYMRVARAKGLPTRVVLVKHGFKNAALGVVTLTGLLFAYMLSGAVIVERVFGIQGIGTLAVDAVIKRDIPMVQGIVVVSAIVVMLSLFFVEIMYGFLNPRLRVGHADG